MGQANHGLFPIFWEAAQRDYDRETTGHKIMLPDSNICIHIGYYIVMNNAGITWFISISVISSMTILDILLDAVAHISLIWEKLA
jgi:hypothetical protein